MTINSTFFSFDPFAAPQMLINMEITRVRRYSKEKAVQIWGYVGDYEVSVMLPSNDPRAQNLMQLQKLSQQIQESRADSTNKAP